jgi:hypothetical protein
MKDAPPQADSIETAAAAETAADSIKTAAARMQDIIEACDLIIRDKNKPALNNCVNYAKECRYRCLAGYNDEDIRMQVLYVLNNMSYWRAPEAKRVRETLKAFVNKGATKWKS